MEVCMGFYLSVLTTPDEPRRYGYKAKKHV